MKPLKKENPDKLKRESFKNQSEMRFLIKENSQKCIICDLTLSTAGSLRAHIKLHSQENVHMCNQCNYTSSKTASLKRHKRQHEEKTHKCIQCEYAANNARSVRAHMIQHNGNGSHKCIQYKTGSQYKRKYLSGCVPKNLTL